MNTKDNNTLVDFLKRIGYIKTKEVERAFRLTDRIKFCIPEQKENAYTDTPLPTYESQTMSQPGVVAMMTEILDAEPGQKILEIGTGSGYQAAILSEIVGEKGEVYTIEFMDNVYKFGKKNLKKYLNVKVFKGDGSKGLKKHAPYDRIIITAGAPEVPKSIYEQLKEGGKIVVPVDAKADVWMQNMKVYQKKKSGIKEIKSVSGFVFVPLKGEEGWPEKI